MGLKACVFDIQSYSIHDGPGIRTTVFLKGCPLRCLWCHNPESNEHLPQLMYYKAKCVGCGYCVDACPQKAIALLGNKVRTNRDLCVSCGKCTLACLYRAREIKGKMMEVAEVFEKAVSDKMFFDNSGGGVTVSGGEPLAQPDFVAALLKRCVQAGIHTAVETCGYASPETVKYALADADLVLYDLKAMDSSLHRKLTGAGNESLLANSITIKKEMKKKLVIRIPVVPGLNDSRENFESTAVFVKEQLGADTPVHLLPYHAMGESKLESMESSKAALNILPPGEDRMQEHKTIMERHGLCVQIGGAM